MHQGDDIHCFATTDGLVTQRESQILQLVAAGKSDWEIGQILKLSAKTVNYHVEKTKRRFGVATRIQAVLVAERRGMLSP
jgi:LuxR family transcriptional regulator, quorum-sensing system regulator BjaR1